MSTDNPIEFSPAADYEQRALDALAAAHGGADPDALAVAQVFATLHLARVVAASDLSNAS